jgi:hypothetical protein
MNYKCPTCGFPQLCGRYYREGFFGSKKLINMPITNTCRHCGSKWKATAIVSKTDRTVYDRVEFLEVIKSS